MHQSEFSITTFELANFRRMTLKPLFIIRGSSDLLYMNDVLNEVPVTKRHDENATREASCKSCFYEWWIVVFGVGRFFST